MIVIFMSWCKNDFQLEIYEYRIGSFVQCPFYPAMDSGFGFLELVNCSGTVSRNRLFNKELSPDEVIPFCIEQGWINKEWQRCYDWFLTNKGDFWERFVWRGINPKWYDKLILLGSTTADFHEPELAWGVPDERFGDLKQCDFIWATQHPSQAWNYTKGFNPSIMVAYRTELLRKIKGVDAYAKRDINMDWKEILEAVFRIYYLY